MRGSRNRGHGAQQFHILGTVIEVVVADQAAVRIATDRAVLLLVYLLENRTLVPERTREFPERLAELLLGDVEDLDLQRLAGLGVEYQVPQTAPRAFHLLELGMMEDLVDLVRQLLVDLRDDGVDGIDRVVGDQTGVLEDLLGESLDCSLDLLLRTVGLGPELLAQQGLESADFGRLARLLLDAAGGFSHGGLPRFARSNLLLLFDRFRRRHERL